VFGRLLGWYTKHTLSGVLALLRNFVRCKIHFASSKSCALVFLQRYCMHFSSGRDRASQTAALSTGRHLYSAGRPSRWALAHILVYCNLLLLFNFNYFNLACTFGYRSIGAPTLCFIVFLQFCASFISYVTMCVCRILTIIYLLT